MRGDDPDPASEAGRVGWRAILQQVLPRVVFFLPSAEEPLFMFDSPMFE
jgi:hypothetical protein